MFTEEQINEILAVCGKATEEPWETTGRGSEYVINKNNFNVCLTRRSHDAQFIALARTALPQLAEEVIKLRAVAEVAKTVVKWTIPLEDTELHFGGADENRVIRADIEALRQALDDAGYGGEE